MDKYPRRDKLRYLSTINIRRESGVYVVQLQDHETMRACTVVVQQLGEAWAALEAALPREEAWRHYNSRVNTRKKPAAREAPKED